MWFPFFYSNESQTCLIKKKELDSLHRTDFRFHFAFQLFFRRQQQCQALLNPMSISQSLNVLQVPSPQMPKRHPKSCKPIT